ncbi:MAG: dihydrolipoyllysine-residue succinyltransferase [Mariprofundaceae bacterium]|nr:dihydrolipoyllysine-residue succinyltransferase [Mariprofundaceae bacterium]
MDIEIKVPSLGESESEATLVSWLKSEGDEVLVDDVLAEIESDKITMEITAFEEGVLKSILKQADSMVEPGEVIGVLDTSVQVSVKASAKAVAKKVEKTPVKQNKSSEKAAAKEDAWKKAKAVAEKVKKQAVIAEENNTMHERSVERVPMSRMRKRIAARLKEAQNTAAMLTTFNEVNMQYVMDMRNHHKDAFMDKYGVKLGFMSFFVKACVYAASKYPAINAYIDGDDVLYHNYMDVGVAVSTKNGLVVPVLKDAGLMSFSEIEQGIMSLASKARDGGLMPDDLKGGTFSITNGGVFGSMLSTPILNTPQSAILGMHTIQKRVMVENDQMVIRPMMYLALSYDHRLIDGKEAVGFLVTIKAALESFGGTLLDV